MPGSVAYTSWSQLRADAWARLEEHSRRAVAIRDRGEPIAGFIETMGTDLHTLSTLEAFWAYPGVAAVERAQQLLESESYGELARLLGRLNNDLVTGAYRSGRRASTVVGADVLSLAEESGSGRDDRPYFEVLIVEDLSPEDQEGLRSDLLSWQDAQDPFVYNVVFASSAPEALIAAQLNSSIQAVVIRRRFRHEPARDLSLLEQFQDLTISEDLAYQPNDTRAQVLGVRLADLRPELDLYLMTEIAVEQMAGELSHHFRRVFHTHEGTLELHQSLLVGIHHRYGTPFFDALRTYSTRPTGVFHALPISQGKSIVNSDWIGDMVDFYGLDIFMAETSSTGGGLDSLLDPTGPLRESQQKAAETFGARHTYFVTNGTSTANKIVAQALIAPGDIVLVDRNCHKSHHYGLMLAGAHVAYLDAYPLDEYAMFGGVPLSQIKAKLLALRDAGQLDRVKMVMLTNCTFDGIVYDVQRVMEECLAIKPDLVFLWDEAWFAFARFHPLYRSRTAMAVADTLHDDLRSGALQARHEEFCAAAQAEDFDPLQARLVPDPDQVKVRVYSTQSTHKTLTALRQGSMIHVHDQDYAQMVQASFHEAYMSHTSTSSNYQILASLDLGRRQAALEGYELVQRQVEYAMRLRDAIDNHPLLSKYMRCLTTGDMIPAQFRPLEVDQPLRTGRQSMVQAWQTDEFVLDPSRVTLLIADTGIDGATFKREQLMDRFGIQVNKTSANTVLFMTNIGTTRSSVAYLMEVLVKIARDLDQQALERSYSQEAAFQRRVAAQSSAGLALPQFSGFHPAFLDGDWPSPGAPGETSLGVAAGDLRAAFYLSYDWAHWEYAQGPEIRRRLAAGQPVVSANFVTPYPPGFPVLVPGQVFTTDIVDYFDDLDTPEVHGYDPAVGYRIFTQEALEFAAGAMPARSDTSDQQGNAAAGHTGQDQRQDPGADTVVEADEEAQDSGEDVQESGEDTAQ